MYFVRRRKKKLKTLLHFQLAQIDVRYIALNKTVKKFCSFFIRRYMCVICGVFVVCRTASLSLAFEKEMHGLRKSLTNKFRRATNKTEKYSQRKAEEKNANKV